MGLAWLPMAFSCCGVWGRSPHSMYTYQAVGTTKEPSKGGQAICGSAALLASFELQVCLLANGGVVEKQS